MTIDATIAKMESICGRLESAPAGLAHAREKYPNAGKPWSSQDEELRRLFGSGNSVDDLALAFARTPKGIRVRLERLGLAA